MAGRVAGKVAVVVGGGQAPGATVGNGRATAIVSWRGKARWSWSPTGTSTPPRIPST